MSKPPCFHLCILGYRRYWKLWPPAPLPTLAVLTSTNLRNGLCYSLCIAFQDFPGKIPKGPQCLYKDIALCIVCSLRNFFFTHSECGSRPFCFPAPFPCSHTAPAAAGSCPWCHEVFLYHPFTLNLLFTICRSSQGYILLYLLYLTMLLSGGGNWGQSGSSWGMMESLGIVCMQVWWVLGIFLFIFK